jgi:hypothetical protein
MHESSETAKICECCNTHDVKEFAATVLNELKRRNNLIEKTMQYKTPPRTVHKILDECINRIDELVAAVHQAGVAHPSQMLERDLKDLRHIRISAGNNYPDYPLLLTSLQRVMAVAERLLPQSPLFSPPLQPISVDQKKPSKMDLPATTSKGISTAAGAKKSAGKKELSAQERDALAREGAWETLQDQTAEAHRSALMHVRAKTRHVGTRTGSSDEETHGRTSSDEEVRRMNHHLRTVSLRSVSESPSLSLSLSRLTMEDGRHVEGIVGIAEGETIVTEEDLEGDEITFQQMQTMLLHEPSHPSRGLTAEERELIEVQGLVEVFEAEEQHSAMQCQICLYSCLLSKKRR